MVSQRVESIAIAVLFALIVSAFAGPTSSSPSPIPFIQCGSDQDCGPPSTFTYCDMGYCRCQPGTVYYEPGDQCQAQADSPCGGPSAPSTCHLGGTCVDGTCKCGPGYIADKIMPAGDRVCKGLNGGNCSSSYFNSEWPLCASNLRCSGGRCKCIYNGVWNSVRQQCQLPVGGYCVTDFDCVENAICGTMSTCICAPGYEYTSKLQKCLEEFGTSCTTTSGCNTEIGLICNATTTRCECPAGQVYEDNKCKNLAGGPCSRDAECGGNSECQYSTKICICSRAKNYVKLDDGTCGRMTGNLNSYCESSANCNSWAYLNCRMTSSGSVTVGRCQCKTGLLEVNGTCRQFAGDACPVSRACVPNAACVESTCTCLPDYTQTTDGLCLKTFDQSCSEMDACNVDEGLICSISGTGTRPPRRCVCAPGKQWSLARSRCLTLISGTCDKSNDLCAPNSHCSDTGFCECDDGFTVHYRNRPQPPEDKFRICLPTYGQPCNESLPCNDEEFLICDTTRKKCRCEFADQQIWDSDDNMCVSKDGGFCGSLPELKGTVGPREMRCAMHGSKCEREDGTALLGKCV